MRNAMLKCMWLLVCNEGSKMKATTDTTDARTDTDTTTRTGARPAPRVGDTLRVTGLMFAGLFAVILALSYPAVAVGIASLATVALVANRQV